MVAACVAITDCIASLPSALTTATEMVLWWTSRPIYLMLSIGCSFRQAWFTASHSNHTLLRKGRPFIMRAPPNPLSLGWDSSVIRSSRLDGLVLLLPRQLLRFRRSNHFSAQLRQERLLVLVEDFFQHPREVAEVF